MLHGKLLRVARPTDRLQEVIEFYTKGLGLEVLYRFQDHEGFDGVMVGVPGASYHLEFTSHQGHFVGDAPTAENILVFYLPNRAEWLGAIAQMREAGYHPVPAYNPYWNKNGLTFADPDGYRVVLQNDDWNI
jgi:catechol 2,3-dioxygenase-like lactoylglutathione lyase family enzyme